MKTPPIIDPNTYYTLGSGTDERAVKRTAKDGKTASLGDDFDVSYGSLLQIYDAYMKELLRMGPAAHQLPPTHPLISTLAVLRFMWLTWCYTAHDLAALREMIADRGQVDNEASDAVVDGFTDEIDSLRKEVATLRAELDEIKASLGTNR